MKKHTERDLTCATEGCVTPRGHDRRCNRHAYLWRQYGSTQDPRSAVECEQCGVEFLTTHKDTARWCSAPCRRAAQNANYAPRCAIRVHACEICTTLYCARTRSGTGTTCRSAECQAERKRRGNRAIEQRYFDEHGEWRSRAQERADPAHHTALQKERGRRRNVAIPVRVRYPEQFAARDARRRMRKHENTSPVVPFDRIAVFERDGWVCQLCAVAVDPFLPYPDPLSKSLDHVVPLARGGAHEFENSQLAHLSCNVAKGARLVTV